MITSREQHNQAVPTPTSFFYVVSMSSGDASQEILEWLERSGYPLEMKVARALREVNHYGVQQAWHFVDPTTKYIREADVVASWTGGSRETGDGSALTSIFFIIECKSTTAPWVVLKDPYEEGPSGPEFMAGLLPGSFDEELISAISESAEWYQEPPPLLDFPSRPGYQVCEKRNSDKSKIDHAYAAVQQVSSAAIGIIKETQDRKQARGNNIPEIAFPVIVTTSPLFEAKMNGSGRLEVLEVLETAIITRLSGNDNSYTIVHIFSERSLSSLAKKCRKTALSFLDEKEFLISESV